MQIKLTYPNILNLHPAGAGHICKRSNFGERNAGTLGTVGTLTKCCHKFYSRTGQNTIILEIIYNSFPLSHFVSPGSVADDPAQPNAVDEISIFFARAGLVIFMVQIGIRRRVRFKKPCGNKKEFAIFTRHENSACLNTKICQLLES